MNNQPVSRSIPHETKARPIRGGKTTCCWSNCTETHVPGSGYCKTHRAEYMRNYRSKQRDELAQLRALNNTKSGVV